jgi:hypothetical protein
MKASNLVLWLSAMAVFLLSGLAAGGAEQAGAAADLPAVAPLKDRWFFAFGYGRNRKDVDTIKALVDTAAEHGLNGMVLSSLDVESITRWSETDVALLREVSAHCERKGIELIPTGFSVGYGGSVLGYDRSFAAALPVTLALQARGGALVPAPSTNLLANGDLKVRAGDRFQGFGFHDRPGLVSFADTNAAPGRTAIRFEKFGDFPHGHGRIMQKVKVAAGRSYRFSCRIKTQELQPVAGLKAMIHVNGRALAEVHPNVKPSQDWTEMTLDYLSGEPREVEVYVGLWEGKSGRFWLSDLSFRETGDLSDIPRREGTPLQLRSTERDRTFEEGKDFQPIRCLPHPEPVLLPPGSAIRDGERLELACYKIPYVSHAWGKQISLCMSNPKLYDYWNTQVRRLYEVVKFKRFLLSMDEIRNGGGCAACRQRGLSMAEILGDCITRQRAILKGLDPEMEVLVWSDMLDPAHNAHADYYGVVGDFTGSWKHVPKDVVMMCWYHDLRDKSLPFFSNQGFRTFGAAYYDADDLTNPREWLASLRRTPQARGIMYTTWQKKYGLLGGFGDLVSAAQQTGAGK